MRRGSAVRVKRLRARTNSSTGAIRSSKCCSASEARFDARSTRSAPSTNSSAAIASSTGPSGRNLRPWTLARISSATPVNAMTARVNVMSGMPPGSGTVAYALAIGASASHDTMAARGCAMARAAKAAPAAASGTYIQTSVNTAAVATTAIASAGIQVCAFMSAAEPSLRRIRENSRRSQCVQNRDDERCLETGHRLPLLQTEEPDSRRFRGCPRAGDRRELPESPHLRSVGHGLRGAQPAADCVHRSELVQQSARPARGTQFRSRF